MNDALLEPFQKELLLKLIESLTSIKTVALIGHGPSLTELANTLLKERRFQFMLAKSSAAALKIELAAPLKATALISYLQQN
ncbi:hypothetical protein [Estrella lausannensis]|uniref:hypothetical protein n=1 Tax=Estrella lausannensis TaxID=483423 RepID=UPI001179A2B0|nr:hypothetical protein [Estrella lausannensis]